MENVISFLTTLKDHEIENMLTFLKEYIKTREVERKLDKFANLLRKQGQTELEIESDRICRLRVMGIIDMDETIRRQTELYKHEQK